MQGRPCLERGDEPEPGGKRKQGSEREHMRSPAYYSCTDGAADEMGGIDGKIRSESKTGRERNGTRARV